MIGDGVLVSRGLSQPNIIRALHPGVTVTVGDGCLLNGVHVLATADVAIGPHSLIAGCLIMTTDFHRIDPARRRESERVNAPVTIGANVWIGTHTTILRGVTIGDDAVIGAGVVVSRDVPPAHVVTPGPPFVRPIGDDDTADAPS